MIVGVTGFLSVGSDVGDFDARQGDLNFYDDEEIIPPWSRAIAAWVNIDPRARMLLSRSGRIGWANDAAFRMLRDAGVFRVVDDHLVSDSGATAAALARLLQEAAPGAATYAVTAMDADRQWLLRCQQLIPGDDDSIGFAAHRMADRICYEAMLQIHHLTPSEKQIVTMMLAGMETGRIAQKQDISIETLRTHIKHAYRKLDVTSRGELFAKAVDFAGL
ncbi:helix-turn-helix transcriptional regulator [Brevundimonas sp. DWR2-3-1b1]|uniref:helix-turn-helix transcriptional regulator n=1 Tax=unclassified Brevundimonas TaxID=2622653 RepID=UPI003CF6425F